jgi:hypothetical protein
MKPTTPCACGYPVTPHSKQCLTTHATLRRRSYPNVIAGEKRRRADPEYRADTVKRVARWRDRNPEKLSAISAVTYAVNSLKLARRCCEKCGTDVKVCGFHLDGYDDPFAVTWRCRMCHCAVQRDDRLAQAAALAISIKPVAGVWYARSGRQAALSITFD